MKKIIGVISGCLLLVTAGWVPVEASSLEALYTAADCAECHAEMAEDHGASVHKSVACLRCHDQAAAEEHEGTVDPVACRACHAPHHEKITHDAHSRVSCRACHQTDGLPTLVNETGEVVFAPDRGKEAFFSHRSIETNTGDAQCRRCHYSGNILGAAAMTLPPKSILCMPCHAATISAGDTVTIISLLVFGFGMIGVAAVWFSGGLDKSVHVVWSAVMEVLLLKRLFRLSPLRWIIHALIYYPIMIRFVIGLVALGLSLYLPDTSVTARMLHKNSMFRGWVFDITGLMMIVGVLAALVRSTPDEELTGLPAPGRAMTGLLGMIVLTGFVLEGVRMAMTGWPAGANHSPLGYGISLLFKGMIGLSDMYGVLWYLHAILIGVFVALIPFTRMLHIVTGPIVIIGTGATGSIADHPRQIGINAGSGCN